MSSAPSNDDSIEVSKGQGNSLTSEETDVDFFKGLKFPPEIDMQEKIEIVRLQLERERLEVEKSKARADQRFWVKNFGASITAMISFAAILVSLSQVWVAKIQKDKELAVAQSQKEKEFVRLKMASVLQNASRDRLALSC